MTEETPIVRQAARVVVLDETLRVLLVKLSYRGRSWWCAPGGGLEAGKTHEQAARREVAEETGLEVEELGPWVWSREQTFRFEGRLVRQVERYFVAQVPAFEARPASLGDIEAGFFDGLRWWTLPELEGCAEDFAPADLPGLIRRLVEEGPPGEPVTVGAWDRRR